jgi:hypothetical protein
VIVSRIWDLRVQSFQGLAMPWSSGGDRSRR